MVSFLLCISLLAWSSWLPSMGPEVVDGEQAMITVAADFVDKGSVWLEKLDCY
jgi:hypothetical protein